MTPAQERTLLASIAVGVDADLQDAMQQILERIDAGQSPAAVVLGVLGNVSADFAAKMASGLSTVYGVDVTVQEVLALQVGQMRLSTRLYAEAGETASAAASVVQRHLDGYTQAREVARDLYEGYGFRKRDVLRISSSNAELPKYLRELLGMLPGLQRDMAVQAARMQVEGLSTSALRAAYSQLLDAIDGSESGAGKRLLHKRLRVAVEERMRYFAQRISQTEIHRAYMAREAAALNADPDVEFVQVRRAPGRQSECICDLYAGRDRYGLGPGVYPKATAPVPTFHPFCRCVLVARLDLTGRRVAGAENIDADRYFLERLGAPIAARIVGSRDKLQRVLDGETTADAIQAAHTDPAYRVRLLAEYAGTP